MKIIVLHEDGQKEAITLTEPLRVSRGQYLNRLITSTGMEHYFTQDGYYDGWGRSLGPDEPNREEALELGEQLDKEREFLL